MKGVRSMRASGMVTGLGARVRVAIPQLPVLLPSRSYAAQSAHQQTILEEAQNEAGPSNYATRPPSSSTARHADPTPNFFTSRRSPKTPLQELLFTLSKSDARLVNDLLKSVNRPRSRREADTFANGIWRRYIRLSHAARSRFDQQTFRAALRAVVPASNNIPHEDELMDRTMNKGLRIRGEGYGERLLKILGDMETFGAESAEEEGGALSSDYRFALSVLAQVGDVHTAEVLAEEMRTRGHHMDVRTVEHRLSALCEWLRRTRPGTLHGHRAELVSTILWRIIGDMTTFELVPRNVTVTLLLRAIYTAKRHIKAPSIVANLDMVLEDVCVKAYGVDTRTLDASNVTEENLKGAHVAALVDYWGAKGEVWKMLSMYEVLVEHTPAVAELGLSEGDGSEEDVPTLSGMMAKEAEGRSRRTWFGKDKEPDLSAISESARLDISQLDTPPHLKSGPAPQYPTSPFTTFFPPRVSLDHLTNTLPPTLHYTDTRVHAETISSLVKHVITFGDMALVNHVLASALASVAAIRTEWLEALRLRQERTGGDISHSDWFSVAAPRVSIDHQWFWDADFFSRRSDAPLVARRTFHALVLEAKTSLEEEKRILEDLPEVLEAEGERPAEVEHDWIAGFRPSKHTDMIDGVLRKMDAILERTQEGIEHKASKWELAEKKWLERQERKMALEQERRGTKKQGKVQKAASVKEQRPVSEMRESGAQNIGSNSANEAKSLERDHVGIHLAAA